MLASQLFSEIIQSDKGEVMNDLGANPRWDGKSANLAALLIMPLVAHERCTGALVLGSSDAQDEYTAGDLKQANALAAIADKARERKIGARGLRMIIEDMMLDLMYQLPSMANVSEVVITKEVVESKVDPLAVLRAAG